jgi:hypothetical protein
MTPEKRQQLIEWLTLFAIELRASDDVIKQMRGRFLRDVLMPAEEWMHDEMARLDGISDQKEYAVALATFVASLVQGLGILLAMGARPVAQSVGEEEWKQGEHLLLLDFKQNYERSMRGSSNGGMAAWMR